MKNILYLFVVIFIIIGCHSGNHEIDKLTHQSFPDYFVAKGGPMILVEDDIIGLEAFYDSCFFILNEKQASFHKFGIKGEGPEEFLVPFNIQNLNDSCFGVYDYMKKEYIHIPLSKNGEKRNFTSVRFHQQPFKVIKTTFEQYVSFGAYENSMYILHDSLGKEIASFYEFPYRDNQEQQISNHIRGMAYQGNIVTNPEKNKFVFAPYYGKLIHFYEIHRDQIVLLTEINDQYPKYEPHYRGEYYGATSYPESTLGYIDIFTTTNYVYLLDANKTVKDMLKDGGQKTANRVVVYNWNGEYIDTIFLDINCSYLLVNEEIETLYGIAYNPDPMIVCFSLSNLNFINYCNE